MICLDRMTGWHADSNSQPLRRGRARLLDEFRSLLSGIAKADSPAGTRIRFFPFRWARGCSLRAHKRTLLGRSELKRVIRPPLGWGRSIFTAIRSKWSGRFIGLKAFLTVAELGSGGIASLLRQQTSVAQRLREELLHAGFSIVNHSPLPLVCFTHPRIESGAHSADSIAAELVTQGRVRLSAVSLSPNRPKAHRACITNHRTSHDDVKLLVSEVTRLLR